MLSVTPKTVENSARDWDQLVAFHSVPPEQWRHHAPHEYGRGHRALI
jgi:hypothetical protein